jgi:hypothetical protein
VVYTHNPPAEFGRASGGVVNLITKGGSNTFHGSAWELYSGSGLNALDGQTRQVATDRSYKPALSEVEGSPGVGDLGMPATPHPLHRAATNSPLFTSSTASRASTVISGVFSEAEYILPVADPLASTAPAPVYRSRTGREASHALFA